MAKISINPVLFLISKRCYTVASENGRSAAAATVARKEVGESSASDGDVPPKGEIFWMRDPKTGNWIPENHFGEIDVVELRNKYLSKTQKL